MGILHRFVSAKAQGSDPTKVQKNEWNESHKLDVDGVVTGQRIGTAADRWYCQEVYGSSALVAAAPTAGRIRAYPYVPSKDMTLDRLAFEVTTLLAGNANVALYADDGNLYPAGKLADGGSISTATVGAKASAAGVVNQAVVGGELYWLTYASSVAVNVRCLPLASLMPILGFAAALGTAPGFGWDVAFAYAAMPANYPAGATPQVAVPAPAIFVRGI